MGVPSGNMDKPRGDVKTLRCSHDHAAALVQFRLVGASLGDLSGLPRGGVGLNVLGTVASQDENDGKGADVRETSPEARAIGPCPVES